MSDDDGAVGANDPADDVHDRAATVRDHLEATETLPLDPAANRWIGEAHAVAADAADPGVSPGVIRRRMREVVSLLEHVEDAGHPAADDRVAAARDAARELADDGEREA